MNDIIWDKLVPVNKKGLNMSLLGARLREERERLGYSQAALADLVGQARKTQTRYEAGANAPDSNYLMAIAGHGADVTYILTGQRSSLPPSPDIDPAIGRRLTEWRHAKGLPIGDLASRIGASIDYVEEIENGARAAKPALLSALERLGLDPDWLMTGAYPAATVDIGGAAFAQIRMLDAQLSAGPGVTASDEVIGNLAFRADWLRREGISPGAASLVRVAGESMEPTLLDGALVLVNHSQKDPVRKGVFALRIGEDVMVKRLHLQSGALLIQSDNPAYEGRVLIGDDIAQVEVIGRVAWQGYTFRQE